MSVRYPATVHHFWVLLQRCAQSKVPKEVAAVLLEEMEGRPIASLCFWTLHCPGLSRDQVLARAPIFFALVRAMIEGHKVLKLFRREMVWELYDAGLLALAACTKALHEAFRVSDVTATTLEAEPTPWLAAVGSIVEHGVTAYVAFIRHSLVDRLTKPELEDTFIDGADGALFDRTLSLLVLSLHLLEPEARAAERFVRLVGRLADGVAAAAEPLTGRELGRLRVLVIVVGRRDDAVARSLSSSLEAKSSPDTPADAWSALDPTFVFFAEAEFSAIGTEVFAGT